VIVTHATPATIAVRHETRVVPNVFVVVADPVGSGFVESFPRPGGNSTGFTNFEPTIGGKWLELLKEIAPAMERVAMVLNPETVPGGINGVQLRGRIRRGGLRDNSAHDALSRRSRDREWFRHG
jgi:hypothetical protein